MRDADKWWVPMTERVASLKPGESFTVEGKSRQDLNNKRNSARVAAWRLGRKVSCKISEQVDNGHVVKEVATIKRVDDFIEDTPSEQNEDVQRASSTRELIEDMSPGDEIVVYAGDVQRARNIAWRVQRQSTGWRFKSWTHPDKMFATIKRIK